MKIIISNLFFLLILLNQNAISKPIPPGSGEGDVPANILILLDSSASMKNKLISGDGIENPGDIVEDSDGNLIVGEGRLGFVKILTTDKTVDHTFADNNRNFRGSATDTCTLDGTNNSLVRGLNDLGLATNVSGVSGDVIYGADSGSTNGKIVGINTSGECVEVITWAELGYFRPVAMEVRTIGGQDHLFASGRWWQGGWRSRFYTKNLTTGNSSTCGSHYGGSLGIDIRDSTDLTVDNSGDFLYYIWRGRIYGYELTKTGNNYCPSDTGWDRRYYHGTTSTTHRKASAIEISREDDSIMYVASGAHNVVQKVNLTGSTSLTSVTLAGRRQKANNTADAGALDADEVNFWGANALFVTSTKVWVSDLKATIQEFNEDKFTAASIDDSWQNEYGGGKLTRYEGAKKAITAVVTDSALTSGANFGYGHWNAGESGGAKKSHRGGWQCHVKLTNCNYYRGWVGDHPAGRSSLCNSDSCLLVGISEEGYTKIPAALETYGLAWGTDANAFSQMALEYYLDPKTGIIDENLDCQLNYVIVIGDGAWRHHSQAATQIEQMRHDLGVKTIVVAYGGGISGGALTNFDNMAIAGSCDDPTGGSKECEPTIVAASPQELKTQLQSKIQQIIAERLSFTAPSITATIQEGGSLYQAQFNYEQHGEWKGTILRKGINANGTVCHDADTNVCPGNWDAAKVIKEQGIDNRRIWTVIPGTSYIGDWNNWKTDNSSDIESLFDELDNTVLDYHNTSSTCGGTDGNSDDVDGLINFVRGTDYFNYRGDCSKIGEARDHVLGDIYHSQLVEVGAPEANTNFTDVNQESYWRAKNNYQSFARSHENRKNIIYAGANDGMLHAINSENGQEEWGFIPPFIAGKLPIIVNTNLDGKVGTNGGGTNPIFGVDGSPVLHDMFIQGLTMNGEWEAAPSWHTILMIPYGRGGAGFSVLDVTYPVIETGQGPLHMFSIFNDAINNRVLVADKDGFIEEHPYVRGGTNISQSAEALKAQKNQDDAEASDGDDCEDTSDGCPAQDLIFACQTNAQAASGVFSVDGTAACYKGTTFTFDLEVPADAANNVSSNDIVITESQDGTLVQIGFKSAKIVGGKLVIEFAEEKIFNASESDLSVEADDIFTIQSSCEGSGTARPEYDYSQLGETWSTPRIFRIPAATGNEDIDSDTYVAVMGGGMGNTFICSGSNVFIVNFEDIENPGSIFGAAKNKGPLNIVDTDPAGVNPGMDTYVATPNGSDVANALPASPVVIT
ncbi:MAG: PilC/PilY family type IV pilus protein, partial [Candidatus Marinimicrobia bacterium]|nr:PilC/PilY family type IV pilus protein [Candidatus Neomarinimicrobiota bacterium]